MSKIVEQLAIELNQKIEYVENVVNLIDEGNTIPFIARYRKELHGSMDDTTLRTLEERLNYLNNLEKRRGEIINSISEQGKLNKDLETAIENCHTLSELEDIYRPYKQKRRTRATIAKERGLAPLAECILLQEDCTPLETLAQSYINPEKDINGIEDALLGASDIIAEIISDNAEVRRELKSILIKMGELESTAIKEDELSVYQTYSSFLRKVKELHGHQVLAINRGEAEGFLRVCIIINEEIPLAAISRIFIIKNSCRADFLNETIRDSYKRLIFPSLERELRNMLTDAANDGAIHNFALNLKPLLLQPPVKGKVTLGYDPGYRNGCKLAVVDATGKVLDTAVIYPTKPHNKVTEATAKLSQLIKKHHIENIAIGNGTASRESEKLVSDLIKDFPGVSYIIVNEAGASVYSASKLAAEEFPEYDVNLRSAVSIARRLQDPLAELVKIEPKAIGVGQYQHDMPQTKLSETLGGVVEDCVNAVGADLNTASASLLTYIAGLTKVTAKNIVAYREENGTFKTRKQLLKVPKLGPKAYEQCAGFLRIPDSNLILDRTGVHPESYDAAKKLLELCGFGLEAAGTNELAALDSTINLLGKEKIADACCIGVPTLNDIVKELMKPGRDIRDDLPAPLLRGDIMEISDLKPGMILTGTVRNVIDFGAFIDIGVHQDGLVHISQICDKYIKHPSEILSVGDIVSVKVLEVDAARKRISLSIKEAK